jgi:hypothetical protein
MQVMQVSLCCGLASGSSSFPHSLHFPLIDFDMPACPTFVPQPATAAETMCCSNSKVPFTAATILHSKFIQATMIAIGPSSLTKIPARHGDELGQACYNAASTLGRGGVLSSSRVLVWLEGPGNDPKGKTLEIQRSIHESTFKGHACRIEDE